MNQISQITIRGNQVILHLADGRELPITIEDMFYVQGWAHDYHLELLELLYQPQEKMFNATQALTEQEQGRGQLL